MMSLKLGKLIEKLDISCECVNRDTDIAGVTSMSDRTGAGFVFVCIKGTHFDGSDFIPRALDLGASVIVCEKIGDDSAKEILRRGAGFVIVNNAREALSRLMNVWYNDPVSDLRIYAVTGTNGKTTVTSMLKSIYSEAGFKCGMIGTLTGALTTPDPEDLYRILSEMRSDGITHVFMEASSHALALDKLAPINPKFGIFTNLTPEHLDFHGTMPAYLAAKKKLFSMCDTGLFNFDSPYAEQMSRETPCKKVSFAVTSDHADFTAQNVRILGAGGVCYDLREKDGMFKIRSTVPGSFTVYNTLAAAACARLDGIPKDTIMSALSAFRGVAGRIDRVRLAHNDYSVYIDFAHTPDALKNILLTVRGMAGNDGRIVLLFGCGGDRDHEKRKPMGEIASALADFVIVTSDNSRSEDPASIIDDIMRGIDKSKPHAVIQNRRDAIEYAINNAKRGDLILLCGKGHEEYEITSDGMHPFRERDIVLAAEDKKLGRKS